MTLREIAHARAGDKGTVINISVIAHDERAFPLIERVVTADRVREHLAGVVDATVVRYVLPRLGALNFVLTRPRGQSVTRTLALDAHGKSLSSVLLGMEIPERDGGA
jgi:hypothetical protein